MDDPGPNPPETAEPVVPERHPGDDGRPAALAAWVAAQRGSFNEGALERSAIAAGYTAEEFKAALGSVDAEAARAELAPAKSTARWLVLAGYLAVWVAFATVYLGRSTQYGMGPILQVSLTVALGIALALSFLAIRRGRPDPERRSRAVALLLVVPVILLVGVAGLCLPFTANP